MWTAPPLRQFTTPNPVALCLPAVVPVPSTTNNTAALCLPISVPAPFAATKPATYRLSTGAPRKFQLYSQLRNLDLNTGSTTVANNKQRQRGAREEQVVEMRGDSKEQEKKLSGFDVLRALEKATAQKMKKRRNGRDSSLLSRKVSGQGKKGTAEDEALADYGNKIVRPLSIKEDWGTRLDELERRLEELEDTAAV